MEATMREDSQKLDGPEMQSHAAYMADEQIAAAHKALDDEKRRIQDEIRAKALAYTAPPQFAVGDVVVLNGHERKMTVTEAAKDGGHPLCDWFDSEGRSQRNYYPEAALRPSPRRL
jgi:uncharacterized protein YodC (DUF2158 family)